jgi:hypothetical protein
MEQTYCAGSGQRQVPRMVGKNDITGDLETLNDIIADIRSTIDRKMISFFPFNLAGQ